MSSAIVAGAIAVPVLVRGAARPRVAKGVAVIARSGSRVLAARVPPASARVEMSRAAWTVARGSAIDSEVRVECNEVEVASKAPLAASVTALSALFLSAMPAMAELDADGVPETSIVTTIFFTIAVLLLGASQSYVFITFFRQLFLCIVFGLAHGLVLLPVLMSFANPKPYAQGAHITA